MQGCFERVFNHLSTLHRTVLHNKRANVKLALNLPKKSMEPERTGTRRQLSSSGNFMIALHWRFYSYHSEITFTLVPKAWKPTVGLSWTMLNGISRGLDGKAFSPKLGAFFDSSDGCNRLRQNNKSNGSHKSGLTKDPKL